ncbi:exodeoxyribonuclease III [Pseudactinotalea sp. HY158]|uniref:exodeoxyribonuclease III n=1 Tax=Pseudactinotalea sp. HY158 TaxID=2654547 RepID=UPI00129D0066|nr:exodeoxyribonuclease III [Pseudactinotalea sp. HY158]QGH70324.1 exodeoxyribonuclease III [Pseudactinotalea sp. HY158]
MFSIATVNVNGVRAAYRRGLQGWIDTQDPDVLLLQEVRAETSILTDHLGDGWHVVHAEAPAKGRAGVAIATRRPVEAVRIGLEGAAPASGGRWIEADLLTPDGRHATVVSVYVHTGTADEPEHMALKYGFLDVMEKRMAQLRELAELDGRRLIIGGDLNIGHTERDIKNWKGNLKSSGFLPEERAYLTRWFSGAGWVDLGRAHAGDVAGPYTWWSYRGKAFDNDAGWRIDYLLADPGTAAEVRDVTVDREPSYDVRISDHAPVRARLDI